MNKDHNFWIGLAAGAAAGVASALLLTPKKGEEIRGEIKHTTEVAGRKAGEAWGGVKDRSADVASLAQEQVMRTADASVEKVSKWRDMLNNAMQADKRTSKEKVAECEANASDSAQGNQI